MHSYESIQPSRYLETLERIQTDILSRPDRTYDAFRQIIEQDPELWEQRADDYAGRLEPSEADLRLQQDLVDQLVINRIRAEETEIVGLNELLADDRERYSGLLARLAVLDTLSDLDAMQQA